MNIERKFLLLERLQGELDSLVWHTFGKYIEEQKILFSDPETWRFEDNVVIFTGMDGCMGCYDPKTIYIPFKFFIDYENSMKELKKENEEKKIKEEREQRKKIEAEEKRELLRLQAKYKNEN